ncbi:hypothetical protein LOTGIDRAFT_139575, partial [Lottia gigantea]
PPYLYLQSWERLATMTPPQSYGWERLANITSPHSYILNSASAVYALYVPQIPGAGSAI